MIYEWKVTITYNIVGVCHILYNKYNEELWKQYRRQYVYYQTIILGVFLKETTYGWDHKATVLVTEDANHQQVLQWTTGKKTTEIDIKSIVNTKYASFNGTFLNIVFLLTYGDI